MPEPARSLSTNLPHAHTIVSRLVRWFEGHPDPQWEQTRLPELLAEMDRLLRPYPEDPADAVALEVADAVAAVGRQAVSEIERSAYRGDRLGQRVRNLFECLGLGREGAELSLRCGERPDSVMRP